MEYLELKVNEEGTFDVPEENYFIKDEVVFFRIPLKVSGSDWACAVKKRIYISTDEDKNGDCLVYAISVSEKEGSCLALNKAFNEGNYAENGCGMMYGLSPRSFLIW